MSPLLQKFLISIIIEHTLTYTHARLECWKGQQTAPYPISYHSVTRAKANKNQAFDRGKIETVFDTDPQIKNCTILRNEEELLRRLRFRIKGEAAMWVCRSKLCRLGWSVAWGNKYSVSSLSISWSLPPPAICRGTSSRKLSRRPIL